MRGKLGADLLVTLGAGSLTDGAKIVALHTCPHPTGPRQLRHHRHRPPNPHLLPVLSIPTSLSDNEYASLADGTDATTSHKHLFPPPQRRSLPINPLRPLATLTLSRIWLSTGIRALDHCVETLCSLSSTPDTDAAAERGLRLLVPALLACKADPGDQGARQKCQMGVLEAMRVVRRGVPVGVSHGVGHQLGPVVIGHGEASCVLLPGVCQFNVGVNGERQGRVVGMLWGEETVAGEGDGAGVLRGRRVVEGEAELGDMLDAVVRELGLPRTLREVWVGREKLDALAENSLRDEWCGANPVPLREKGQVLGILEAVLG